MESNNSSIYKQTSLQNSYENPIAYSSKATVVVSEDNFYTEIIAQKDKVILELQLANLKHSDYDDIVDTCKNQAVKINSLEKELKQYKDKLEETQRIIKDQEVGYDNVSQLDLVYDITDYPNVETSADINRVWQKYIDIAMARMSNKEYVMKNSSDIIPFYILITEDPQIMKTCYHYSGSFSDFCECWNVNIKKNIDDKDTVDKLTCKHDSLKAEKNRAPWKTSSIASWKRICNEDAKNKTKMKRALNIRVRLVG